MPRITIRQEGTDDTVRATVSKGILLKNAVAMFSFDLRASCGGVGVCKKCKVFFNRQEVLACQTRLETGGDIFIPASSIRTNEKNAVVQTSSLTNSLSHHTATEIKRSGHRFGIAVDIGTTTLAVELHRLDGSAEPITTSRANPQRQLGDDVLSRIQAVMQDINALRRLQKLVVGAINEMVAELAQRSEILVNAISIVTAAGNSVMQLLLHGIDPSPLGVAPFQPPVSVFPRRPAKEIGLNLADDAILETLPIFGGFVGGDIVAGVIALNSRRAAQAPEFLIDIGTNGELVLLFDGQLNTAATAAGPAFEGARIEYGTLAVPGAMDHFWVEDGKLRYSTIGGVPAIGLCGSGLIDVVAVLLNEKIIKPNGQFSDKAPYFELVPKSESGIGKPILLTQRDIRQLQLAAGAIRAGTMLLMERQNILPKDIETFYVAGGFGQFISPKSAQRIGLLPREIPLERIKFCGNTSLAGARSVLFDPDLGELALQKVAVSQSVELARSPRFAEVFAESMLF